MAKSQVFKKGRGEASFNMTPMIDVTFQLIIFFIIAGQIASESLAKLIPPKPYESVSQEADKQIPNRVIVNILSRDPDRKSNDRGLSGQASEYKIGSTSFDVGDTEELAEVLGIRRDRAEAAGYEDFFVEIRAHHTVFYDQIEPVMLAAAKAKIPKMSITARMQTFEMDE